MTDREKIDSMLDLMAKLQKENRELLTYIGILEKLLGVVHLEDEHLD